TLKPHFYPTDTLRLDAKGMDLQNIAIIEKGYLVPLKFSYDSLTIAVRLNRTYHAGESYTIYISYTAKPTSHGSHGPYFITPTGSERGVPTQIWTTGEPEHNSCWFSTIDKPNQKCTDEISLTVPA